MGQHQSAAETLPHMLPRDDTAKAPGVMKDAPRLMFDRRVALVRLSVVKLKSQRWEMGCSADPKRP
jgi:hypothetical protein